MVMSNDEWIKFSKETLKEDDITERLLYWAQNEDMIDQYYTKRGEDLMEARQEIIDLRDTYMYYHQLYKKAVERIRKLEGLDDD
jgi:hypothetical protein